MNRIFERYKELADKAELSNGTKRSKDWFRKLVSSEPHIHNIDRIGKNLQTVSKMRPGLLVTYEYDAKLKDKLRFWDRFPLIFVLNVTRDGWTGLNVHYLHPLQRAKLFYDYQKNGKAFIDHDIGKRASKRYLASHVVTRPKEIPKDLWEIAIQLPFENFQGMSSKGVWNQTSRKK